MINTLRPVLNENGIELVGAVSLGDCTITKPYLLEREGISEGTAFIFAAPYYTAEGDGSVSAYAIPRDYHLFFLELFPKLISVLKMRFPENKFVCFADHSPIKEVEAAAKCGLGIIGKNGLLITEKYSSFVFLAALITDAKTNLSPRNISECEDCGLCKKACPSGLSKKECLSAITQKKGELSEQEEDLIKKYGTVWGCDICQRVCPHTKEAIATGTVYTPIDFFKKDRIPFPTYRIIQEMTDEEFSFRAYSWRGKDVLLRNLKLFEKE